jgi:DNA repair ATPase RecN
VVEEKKMTDQAAEILAYIHSRLVELNTIHEQAEKALNAVQGKDHVTKWKRKVVEELTPLVSPAYLQHLSAEWLETTYFVGDVFDELSDEVDMCRRHLKKLAKDIQASGIP